ncbi:nitrous oxide reductase accessory protein NosL [Paramagnetospirillum kuznetsovii]|uniref:Nitrous oxide reductase accessory protein NosL n=1 Tax=Paramagnetospirillum kuznetsovii TaxID=2053833 RepID=A0A364NTC2_9PROT|nr:nitrous oxide reductase accessory protein NosL [Paramagnetospirillum kuznetsovii]RAU20333.1 nitrous oxide reductase accessory protein NosL [Paramagnetospirillum kuznetsovii]
MRLIAALLLSLFLLSGQPKAGEVVVAPPGPNGVCPVCGMFVAKYPEWAAAVVFKDGHTHYFDGAKDLFKFMRDVKSFDPGHSAADIAIVAVTDYYGVKTIDARDAFFVVGSDVLGPMGHELVPLATKQDAEEFMADHKGKRILSFDQVGAELLKSLDKGGVK